ncbi:DNA-binding response regulator [Clostridium butyricum]
MLDNQRVKELYLKGENYISIASILNAKPDAIRKHIYRNLREFRNSHEAEKIRRKEIDRITRYESKSYMSDNVFINKNRSAYKTDAEGNIVINTDVAPVISFDTPRKLVNENSKKLIDKRIIKSNYKRDELFG